MAMIEQLITNSRMKAFQACARLHHLTYVLGYRPVGASHPLEFGTIIHTGLEAWWLAYQANQGDKALELALAAIAQAVADADTMDDVAVAKAELLMQAYDARWAPTMGEYEVIAVERQFEAPLTTPTGRRARGLKIAGKLDVLVRRMSDGTVWIVEHKTTSSDLSPGSTYWARLRMDSQISMYHAGVKSLGLEPTGCLYDVIKKPDHRLLQATPEASRKYTKDGKLYAAQRAEDETMDAFKARMAAALAEAPEAWFQRAEIVRLDSELAQSRADVHATAMFMRAAAKAGNPPRSTGACFQHGRECDFYPVCSGAASIEDPSRFTRSDNVHPELSIESK